MLVVVAAIFGLGWGLDRLFERMSDRQSSDEITILTDYGESLSKVVNELDDPDSVLTELSTESIKLALQGRVDFPLPDELADLLARGEALVLESEEGVSVHYLLRRHDKVLSLVPDYLGRQQRGLSLNLIFTIVFYSGILLFVFLWIYPLVSRLLHLRRAARNFGEGDLAERINLGRYSYIRDIENEFNRMADRIQTLISDNKLLASAVSHDLRTPLARLRFGIDTLAETEDPQKREQYSEKIGQDLDEMERLVSTLLSYARLDQSMGALEKRSLDLVSLTRDACEKVCVECPGLEFAAEVESCLIDGDSHHLKMLINNVLQNACKYGKDQICVRLTCSDGKTCCLTIEDNGVGIAASDRESMLKPFVRGKSQIGKGYGMGLAIVARIALWHEASLQILDSDLLGGAKFQFDFRLSNQG